MTYLGLMFYYFDTKKTFDRRLLSRIETIDLGTVFVAVTTHISLRSVHVVQTS